MLLAGVGLLACSGAELHPTIPGVDLMAMPSLAPRYTAAEIRTFPDHRVRYEVIRGQLFVTPAPGTRHQRAVMELARQLQDYLDAHRLGEALPAPFEVQFTDDSAVQPDVLVILESQRAALTGERFHGPPALVVEVVSYSSKRTDRLEKRTLYQTEGVPEYWIVDVDARQVERWRSAAREPEILTADLMWQPGPETAPLKIALPALFARVWR
jgi:Uma2 family endonuclease